MSKPNRTRPPEGVEERHKGACRLRQGGRCNCAPSYRGKVTGPDGRRVHGPWGPSSAAAKNWRTDQLAAINQGFYVAPSEVTLRCAAEAFIAGARAGHVLSRKGRPYRPSVVRDYESGLRRHVLPVLGDRRLTDVRRGDLQRVVDQLVVSDLAGSTIRNALDPVRRIFDRALKRDQVLVNPTVGLDVPRATGKREHIAAPGEAAELIAALPEPDQGVWATALYAGLRMGELRALRWSDVDLEAGVLHVRRTWDDVEGEQCGGKTDAARRDVTIIPELRPVLLMHKLATGRREDDLVFGRTATDAPTRSTIRSRANRAWKAAELTAITPHECRHTFASMMLAAGVDRGEVMRQMGHAGSAVLDRYTHGIDGSVAEAGRRLQAYIDGATRAAG